MRSIFLIAIISLFGHAMAQPDTVWTRNFPIDNFYPTSVVKTGDSFLTSGNVPYTIDGHWIGFYTRWSNMVSLSLENG